MEYNCKGEGAIDDTQGSTYDSYRSTREERDGGLPDILVRDEGQLDGKGQLPTQVHKVKKRRRRRSGPEPTHSISIEALGETPTDNAIKQLISLGWIPTIEKIERFREVMARQMDVQPSLEGKYGDRSNRGIKPKILNRIRKAGY